MAKDTAPRLVEGVGHITSFRDCPRLKHTEFHAELARPAGTERYWFSDRVDRGGRKCRRGRGRGRGREEDIEWEDQHVQQKDKKTVRQCWHVLMWTSAASNSGFLHISTFGIVFCHYNPKFFREGKFNSAKNVFYNLKSCFLISAGLNLGLIALTLSIFSALKVPTK